jgi:HTH-type transcriptional regulator/antitoxin HigA
MFDLKPIKTTADYEAALKLIDTLWDANPDTKEGDCLEVLSTLVEKYEAEHFPIEAPDPIEAIKFVMEQKDLDRAVLTKALGSKSRVSEILKKNRRLTLGMMRRLHDCLDIPYEILMAEYRLYDNATQLGKH